MFKNCLEQIFTLIQQFHWRLLEHGGAGSFLPWVDVPVSEILDLALAAQHEEENKRKSRTFLKLNYYFKKEPIWGRDARHLISAKNFSLSSSFRKKVSRNERTRTQGRNEPAPMVQKPSMELLD